MSEIKFQDIHDYFSSSRRLKNFIKRCDFALLLELQGKINVAITEWEQETEREQEAIRMRDEKLKELLGFIASEGFSPQDLIAAAPVKTKAKREMKYQYNDAGKIKKWSGVGRIPRAIQEQLNSGALLNDFLIDNGTGSNDEN